MQLGWGVTDDCWSKARFKASKSLPLFIHFGVARIINAAEVKDCAVIFFGSLEGCVGEEGGGVESVANFGNKGGVIGGDTVVVENEESANQSVV